MTCAKAGVMLQWRYNVEECGKTLVDLSLYLHHYLLHCLLISNFWEIVFSIDKTFEKRHTEFHRKIAYDRVPAVSKQSCLSEFAI